MPSQSPNHSQSLELQHLKMLKTVIITFHRVHFIKPWEKMIASLSTGKVLAFLPLREIIDILSYHTIGCIFTFVLFTGNLRVKVVVVSL